jgi:hypothetical protein
MKKTILVFTIATVLGAAVFGSVLIPKKLKPAKQEFPTVIIPTQNYNQYTNLCPRENTDYKNASERPDYQVGNAEDSIVFAKHCHHCSIGVYSEHKNETVKKCTYCGYKDPTDLTGE